MFVYAWVWGHPLGHGKVSNVHILKRELLFLSNCRQPMAPQEQVGTEESCPPHLFIKVAWLDLMQVFYRHPQLLGFHEVPYYIQKTALLSTSLYPLTLTFCLFHQDSP